MDSADKRIAEEKRYCMAMLTVLLGVVVALAGAATTNPVWRLPVFIAFLALASMCPLGVILLIRHRKWPPSLAIVMSIALSAYGAFIVGWNL